MTNKREFGARKVYTQADLQDNQFSQRARCDGLVLAVLGTMGYQAPFMGMVSGTTRRQEQVTRSVLATASTQKIDIASGKKAGSIYYIPLPGSFTLPVRAGETWNISLTADAALAPVPELTFYWLPTAQAAEAARISAEQSAEAYRQFHQFVSSGRLRASVVTTAQATIDGRVQDLARVFGSATGMNEDEHAQSRFVHDLQKIVCSAHLPGESVDQELRGEDVETLIATFGDITGHQFDAEQQGLLDAGIRALVQINDNEENRNNLNLIQHNIGLFLDNVQQVLGKNFDSGQRRLLTRALVRLVGDGSHA